MTRVQRRFASPRSRTLTRRPDAKARSRGRRERAGAEPLAWLAADLDSDPLTRTDGRDWRARGDGASVEPAAHRASVSLAREHSDPCSSLLLSVCGARV